MTLNLAGTDRSELLTLNAPAGWSFDDRSTFTDESGAKAAEVLGLYQVPDELSFPAELTEAYDYHEGDFPEGYGLQSTSNIRVNGRQILTYYYKTWPDDADKPWYPRYCFVNLGGWVVQINFFTFDENADDTVYSEVIASMELHLQEDKAG